MLLLRPLCLWEVRLHQESVCTHVNTLSMQTHACMFMSTRQTLHRTSVGEQASEAPFLPSCIYLHFLLLPSGSSFSIKMVGPRSGWVSTQGRTVCGNTRRFQKDHIP